MYVNSQQAFIDSQIFIDFEQIERIVIENFVDRHKLN